MTHSRDKHATLLSKPKRVMVLGATGTIGQATVRALLRNGHEVVCFIRANGAPRNGSHARSRLSALEGVSLRIGEVTKQNSLLVDGFKGEKFDVLISCLASRTGSPRDAWAIDYEAHVHALAAAQEVGVSHVVLLSAICVQKPLLAFQHAKLAFENILINSGIPYSIVRPTAYFKSLSGQIERLKAGKPFLVFGNGNLTACKPISDEDLGEYLVHCLNEPSCHNRILPIGGPGEAITPKQQGELIFNILGQTPKFKHVPVLLLDAIVWTLSTLCHIFPSLTEKSELARIGKYYATESMLVLNSVTGKYDAHATPSAGTETLFEHYERIVRGEVSVERGDHSVF